MLVECVSLFPQHRDNDRNGYEDVRTKFEWIACPVAQKIRKEAVVSLKYIVLKKSLFLPSICRGIFTLNHGTAKPFLTVLFEPNLSPAYVKNRVSI